MTIDSTSSRLASEGVRYATQIAGAARKHGLNPELLAAVAAQETGGPGSNGGHNIVGDDGRGVFQIDDRWHDFAKTPEAMDPQDNADYAAGMISGLLKRYGGNVHEALSAYNAGDPDATGTRTRWGDGRNLGYADSVIEHYRRLTGTSGAAPGTSGAEPGTPNDPSPQPPQPPGINGSGEPAELAELLQALESMASSGAGSMQPPTPAQPPQSPQSYHRQMTDYSSLFDDDDNG